MFGCPLGNSLQLKCMRVEMQSHGVGAWVWHSSKCAPVFCVFVVCGSLGFFFFAFFKVPGELHVCDIEFSYLAIFWKSHRSSKHGKMLNCSKFVIVNFTFTLLSDIDNTKPTRLLKVIIFIFYFWLGCPLSFLRATNFFILPKSSRVVNFLLVWDDWMTANFKHCLSL